MSYGQSLLKEILLRQIIGSPLEDYRPAWMNGLELDFYYEEHRLAFEFQGDQHFLPVFGQANLIAQHNRDTTKRRLCRQLGIVLVKVEAHELIKFRLSRKLFAAANSYLKGWTRSDKRAWVAAVEGRTRRAKSYTRMQSRGSFEDVKAYCAKIKNMGGITAVPKRHTRIRASVAARFLAGATTRA